MLRQSVYLRLNAEGKIERCLKDLDEKGRVRSLADVDKSGPWTLTVLSMDLCYEREKTFGELITELATLEQHENLDSVLPTDLQIRIGRSLFGALFGDGGDIRERWLHMVPLLRGGGGDEDDAFLDLVCRLPWTFILKGRQANAAFYANSGAASGAVTVDAGARQVSAWSRYETKMEPRPSLLAVVPRNYPEKDRTFGVEHLARLREALPAEYSGPAGKIAEARSFAEFKTKLSAMRPRIVYFYGHASSSEANTHFLFDRTESDEGVEAVDVATLYAEMNLVYGGDPAPPVVWINACQGAAAQRNSFLRLLSPISACVVTTRTLSLVADSRALAERALPLIVRDGRAPHSAIRQALSELKPDFRKARWATTVISVQYDLWSALLPEKRDTVDLDSAGDFPMRLDRKSPLETLFESLRWLISTNGARHKHPDPEAVSRIVLTPIDGKELIFNARSEYNQVWSDKTFQDAYKFVATYPEAENLGGVRRF